MAKREEGFITEPEVLQVYKNMIQTVSGVVWKGKTHPYLSLNGNMYSSISKDHVIGIRLSKTDCEDYLEQFQTGLFEPFPGFFQKNYVPIPNDKHADLGFLKFWFAKSFANATSLKAKPTKKPKAR